MEAGDLKIDICTNCGAMLPQELRWSISSAWARALFAKSTRLSADPNPRSRALSTIANNRVARSRNLSDSDIARFITTKCSVNPEEFVQDCSLTEAAFTCGCRLI